MITNIVLVVGAVIALVLIAALFTKKAYSFEREIVINKPKQEVFDFIKYIKNQEKYNKWTMMDPASKKETLGTDGTPGFIFKWDSEVKNVGKGEQEIKAIKEGERMDLELRFIKPFTGVAQSYMITEAQNTDLTKVRWGFSSAMPYPMNLMLLFVNMEKMLGNDLQESLHNLKSHLEK